MKGKITEWNDSNGYGFISALNGNLRVFIHASSVKNSNHRPRLNDEVTFEVREDNRGRLNAVDVTIEGKQALPLTVLFGCSYLVFACAALIVFRRPLFIIPLYIGISIITYVMFSVDKKAAQTGQWRTPENSLHMLSLFGGWPGALFAQNQLRHKSKKQPFKAILWFTIILNISAFLWTFTPSGIIVLQRISSVFY